MSIMKLKPKSRVLIFLFGLILVSLMMPCVTALISHPISFNIKQSPGYLNRAIEPWHSAEESIFSDASTGLTTNFNANNADRHIWQK